MRGRRCMVAPEVMRSFRSEAKHRETTNGFLVLAEDHADCGHGLLLAKVDRHDRWQPRPLPNPKRSNEKQEIQDAPKT